MNATTSGSSAGGRHDNDFSDFRLTAILPTADEMGCTEAPFYRQAEEITQLSGDQRIAAHLDNQFRLLREDMLSGLRDDFQIAQGTKKGRRTASRLEGLSLATISCTSSTKQRIQPCTVGVFCDRGLEKVQSLPKPDRKVFLKNNHSFVKHQAFGCLVRNSQIVAFATIERDLDSLEADRPVVMLRISDEEALKRCLLYLKLYNDVNFLVVDTPIFAYEPILKCLQDRIEMPLVEELFLYEHGQPVRQSSLTPFSVVEKLKLKYGTDLQGILQTKSPVTLENSQLDSLVAGLSQRVSLIQGPPGQSTGDRNEISFDVSESEYS